MFLVFVRIVEEAIRLIEIQESIPPQRRIHSIKQAFLLLREL